MLCVCERGKGGKNVGEIRIVLEWVGMERNGPDETLSARFPEEAHKGDVSWRARPAPPPLLQRVVAADNKIYYK